jgi:peptidoglycan/LPS O-acetylase OafA/YrhL
MVVVLHSAIASKQDHPGVGWLIYATGQRGVQLFYELSAFTLFLSLDNRRSEHYATSNFFIRRFFRIAPLFYLAIVLNLIANRKTFHVTPGGLLLGLSLLHGLSPTWINTVAIGGWSVGVEVVFYMFVPLLYQTVRSMRQAWAVLFISAIVLGVISHHVAKYRPDLEWREYFEFLYPGVEFPVFVMGIFTYFGFKSMSGRFDRNDWDEGARKGLSILFLTLAGVIYQANLPISNQNLYSTSFLFVALILGLSLYPWKLVVNRVTIHLGRISYSMYLLHFFVLIALQRTVLSSESSHSAWIQSHILVHRLGMPIVFLWVLVPASIVATLTWRFIEQPFIAIGKRIINHREARYGLTHAAGH